LTDPALMKTDREIAELDVGKVNTFILLVSFVW